MTFKILSLDGGGIRGVLSTTILEDIEAILREQKGQELYQYFDLVAGTSTGSILAAGIGCQMQAKQLTDLYQKRGKDIFLESVRRQRQPRGVFSWLWQRLILSWLRRLKGSYALYPHEQGNQGLAKVLEQQLIYDGKSPKISEITQPHLLILAYDVLSRNTTWFTNNNPDQGRWYDDIELWKICTASASAPTFFPPYELPYNSEQNLPHIDGGVSANNPALTAIAHALWMNKGKADKLKLSDIAVLSIGTGKTTNPYTYQEIANWGLLGWIKNLTDIFMNPSAINSEDICTQLLESVGGVHLRLDFELNQQFEGERKPNRLRELIKKPYNEYLFQKNGRKQEIKEDIDNPDICQDLIEAAQGYLEYGKVDYDNERVPVRCAIKQFIESH
ncbi:MAG: patatin [Symploca sp. SIO2E9]|nr:patatin [Symploca sp. SIO2E9]